MAKYLVVIESPGKTKTIQNILGKDYEVFATMGHIVDLPVNKLSVDIKKDFEPTYKVMDDKKDVVRTLVQKAEKADLVYLATDGDREGSGIAFHIKSQLPKGTKTKRMVYHEITAKAIKDALQSAGNIDMDMVESYECRRILDRLVGYKCSYVTKQATGGSSAGRVQSAALRILAEREKEILAFKPVTYWDIEAELLTGKKEKIIATIKIPKPLDISTEKFANEICDTFKKGPIEITKYEKKQVSVGAYAPFTTSTLLQAASSIFGWNSAKTMGAAQNLYQAGHITYMRTDSVNISAVEIPNIRAEITKIGAKYLPTVQNVYSNKQSSQGAHEAIRPTHVDTPSLQSVGADESKLYEMIWARTVSSQMKDAQFIRSSAEFTEQSKKKYVLSANGNKCIFDGWRKVWTYSTGQDQIMPELTEGEEVDLLDIKKQKKETQPPSRYSEASFIKRLEDLGIGRPSTYKTIPTTLRDRKYIEDKSRSLVVTSLGLSVTDFLVQSNFCFVDLKFTANLENKLDDIADKKTQKILVLKDFWDQLKKDIENAQKTKASLAKTTFECPDCKKNGVKAFLVKKNSKFGAFFSCENYKSDKSGCNYMAVPDDKGSPVAKAAKPPAQKSQFVCTKCGKDMMIRKGPYGDFLGCQGYPKCKEMMKLDGTPIIKGAGGKKFRKWKKKTP